MSFVYLLVFVMKQGGTIELKEYDTWEMCQAAAFASNKEHSRVMRATQNQRFGCIPKPA
jgi:hypothetical protein